MKIKNFIIDVDESNIDWVGRKVTGSHFGTIGIKEGIVLTHNGNLTGGKFIIDATSIRILDVSDPATNAQFAGHLASEDFFASAKYPEAVFEIRSVAGNHVEGDLTIRGISHPVGFDAQIDVSDDTLRASGSMVIDRTWYNMKFRSGNFFQNLGDTLIYNDFDLNITITAKAAA